MILLDTNYLINALVPGSPEAEAVLSWIEAGEGLCTSSVAWYEFLCGPVSAREVELMSDVLSSRILHFGESEAAESARLFNTLGRPRRLRIDAMIAATAVLAGAPLATDNLEDFTAFVAHGLRLAS